MIPKNSGPRKAKPKTNQKETTTMKTKLVKNMASCSLFACALVGLIAAMVLGTPNVARADSRLAASCSVYTLHGSYLFATHGWNIVSGVAQPKAIVEGINFNGDGTLVSPFATVSINGTIIRSTGSLGTYTVNADCTGTLSFTGGGSFDIFVQAGGQQLWMIQTGGLVPAVFEGTVTRVP
jgi:hypothetical protein